MPTPKPPTPIHVGMKADEVLKLRGRHEDHAVKDLFVSGADEHGLVVEWYYADCTVELRHDGTLYRVVKVTEKGEEDE